MIDMNHEKKRLCMIFIENNDRCTVCIFDHRSEEFYFTRTTTETVKSDYVLSTLNTMAKICTDVPVLEEYTGYRQNGFQTTDKDRDSHKPNKFETDEDSEIDDEDFVPFQDGREFSFGKPKSYVISSKFVMDGLFVEESVSDFYFTFTSRGIPQHEHIISTEDGDVRAFETSLDTIKDMINKKSINKVSIRRIAQKFMEQTVVDSDLLRSIILGPVTKAAIMKVRFQAIEKILSHDMIDHLKEMLTIK